jgi:DNA-binding GntR family transcriptional regulator
MNAAAKNPILTATYEQVNARLQALRFKSNQDEEKWKSAVIEHEQMIDALDKRDGRALQEILLKHLHNKRDVVVMQLQIHANTSTDKNQKA